ncbi:hypothetical protein DY000_02006932 [Brassica cretica]|uniref:Uncharacterized protein n=1 Tax=Brassica cretica TaxID=69181 RepID=A0ABQ7CE73_BRACR|nr:hypothetical protein DY000_02006932 [Brassica cretica]
MSYGLLRNGGRIELITTVVEAEEEFAVGLSALPHVAPDEQYQFIVDVCSSHVDQLLAGNSFELKL